MMIEQFVVVFDHFELV